MMTARLAGFATRALAFAIDLAILNVVTLAVGAAGTWAANVFGLEINPSAAVVASLAAAGWLALISVYFVVFWCLAGQTPGMRFMGIRVTDLHGATPSLARSLRRLVGAYLAAIPAGAGFLLVLVDDRRRGLHDRVARTLVVHDMATTRDAVVSAVGKLPIPRADHSMIGAGRPTTRDQGQRASSPT